MTKNKIGLLYAQKLIAKRDVKIKQLEKENKQLKDRLNDVCICNPETASVTQLMELLEIERENKELKEQNESLADTIISQNEYIEKMKCLLKEYNIDYKEM